jgi:hypothetical protein
MKRRAALGWVVVAALVLASGPAGGGLFPLTPFSLEQPQGQGDQVLYYYDARPDFTTFLNLRNATDQALDVRVLFFSGDFSEPFQLDLSQVPAGALRIVDVGTLRTQNGLAARAGVAMAFATNETGQPVVTRGLTGSFTVANLQTGSGWGAPGAARSALTWAVEKLGAQAEASADGGERAGPAGGLPPLLVPPLGTVIDGITTLLQPIQPAELDLAAYYNPNDLAPVDKAGNQLIFVSFTDIREIDGTYSARASAVTWGYTAMRSNGSLISTGDFTATGVTVSDLASVAGSGVAGSAGSIRFVTVPVDDSQTRLVYFAEALGTFGTGYLLPVPSRPEAIL